MLAEVSFETSQGGRWQWKGQSSQFWSGQVSSRKGRLEVASHGAELFS